MILESLRGATKESDYTQGSQHFEHSDLIDPITGSWDNELLVQTFWGAGGDVEIIKSIPVHPEMDDVVAWHYDVKGIFSVRSAYKIFRAKALRASGRSATSSGSAGNADEPVWKKLWKLSCPGKIKHFLWRLCHDSLAVRTNLARRGMELDTLCVVCNRLDEDGGHLFCKCKYVFAKDMLSAVWELEEKDCIC